MLELEALSEIYDSEVLNYNINDDNSILSGEFVAWTKLFNANPISIFVDHKEIQVFNIPPIYFNFKIKINEDMMPDFSVFSNWLPFEQLQNLTDKLKSIMEENFTSKFWSSFEYLENHAVRFLTDNENNNDMKINISDLFPLEEELMLDEILENFQKFDANTVIDLFEKSIVECSICMVSKRGSECIKLSVCSHLFCRICFQEYFNSQICQGLFKNTCPVCSEEIHYNEVKNLINKDTFERWENLSFKHCIKGLEDHKMCPKCHNYIAVINTDEFGFCKPCRHTFCLDCGETYNGSNCCRYKLKGYKPIKEIEDEKAKRKFFFTMKKSEDFIGKNFVHCPKCGTSYQKEGNCNHLRCTRCDTEFCFICMKELPYADPGSHFAKNCLTTLTKTEKSNLNIRRKNKR